MTDLFEIIKENFSAAKGPRDNYDVVNQEIVDYIAPNKGDFIIDSTPGFTRDELQYDDTATAAAEDLVSILISGLLKDEWFRLTLQDPEELRRAKPQLEAATDLLLSHFKNKTSRFYQHAHEFLTDIVYFGYACMQVTLRKKDIVYQTIHPSEIYFEEDQFGDPNTVYRKYEITLKQAFDKWDTDIGPEAMKRLGEKGSDKIQILHCVMPAKDFERAGGTMKNKTHKFASVTLNLTDHNIIKESGFKMLPYVVARWSKRSGDVYGISPAWNVLSTIKMLNSLNELYLKSEQKVLDPPLLTSDELPFLPLETFPGGINPGGIDENGQLAIQPFPSVGTRNSKIDLIVNRLEKQIETAFFVDQFRARPGVQPLTATETLDNRDKRLTLISPHAERLKIEWLNRIIDLTIELKKNMGSLGKGDETDVIIEYTGTLSYTQNSEKLLAYNRFFANAASFFQLNPELIQNLNMDESIRKIAELSGVPVADIKSEDERDEELAAQQEQQQESERFAKLESSAKSAKDLSAAGINITQ